MAERLKILFLASNPKDSKHLRLEDEAKYIDDAIGRSNSQNEYQFYNKGAVTIQDLNRAMLDIQPNVVHFSGHGSEEDTLLFEDNEGYAKEISSDALGEFFSSFSDHLQCVFLNACYSLKQAQGIIDNVPIVIGMNSAIPNSHAKVFSQSFYESYCKDKTVQEAFDIAKNVLAMVDADAGKIPLIHVNEALITSISKMNDSTSNVENGIDTEELQEDKSLLKNALEAEVPSDLEFQKAKTMGADAIKSNWRLIIFVAALSIILSIIFSIVELDMEDDWIIPVCLSLNFLAIKPWSNIQKRKAINNQLEILKIHRDKLLKLIPNISGDKLSKIMQDFYRYLSL